MLALDRVDWASKAAWVDRQVERGARGRRAVARQTTRGIATPTVAGLAAGLTALFFAPVAVAGVATVAVAGIWNFYNRKRRQADLAQAREAYEQAIREQMADNVVLERQQRFEAAEIADKTSKQTAQLWDRELRAELAEIDRYQRAQAEMTARGNHLRNLLSTLHGPNPDFVAITQACFDYEAHQQAFIEGLDDTDEEGLGHTDKSMMAALDFARPQLAPGTNPDGTVNPAGLLNEDGTVNLAAVNRAQQQITDFNAGIGQIPQAPAEFVDACTTFLQTPPEHRSEEQVAQLLGELRASGAGDMADEMERVRDQIRTNLTPTDPTPGPQPLQLPPPEVIGGFTGWWAQRAEKKLGKADKKVTDQKAVVATAEASAKTLRDELALLPEVTDKEFGRLTKDLETALTALHSSQDWLVLQDEFNSNETAAADAKTSLTTAQAKVTEARERLAKLGVTEEPSVAPDPAATNKCLTDLDVVNDRLEAEGIEPADRLKLVEGEDEYVARLKQRAINLNKQLEIDAATKDLLDWRADVSTESQIIQAASARNKELVAAMEQLELDDSGVELATADPAVKINPGVKAAREKLADAKEKRERRAKQQLFVTSAEDTVEEAKAELTTREGRQEAAKKISDKANTNLQQAQKELFDRLEAEIKKDQAEEARRKRREAEEKRQQAEADRQAAATQGHDGDAAPAHMHDAGNYWAQGQQPYAQPYAMPPQWPGYPPQQQWAPGWPGMPAGYPVQVMPGYGQPVQVPVQAPYQYYGPQYGQPAAVPRSAAPTNPGGRTRGGTRAP